jgi:RNA recognition motif 2
VRNIPNKYQQQMLLDEINVSHEGTYDFFYLPIDFKNKCNVGYCFINFLDPKHIVAFVKEFNGLRWKSFNSEKVCAITFARIQGKGSMVSRFQNSSLLEKDDEYRPLLFFSSGPDRGKPEPFPSSSRSMASQQHQQHSSTTNTTNSNTNSNTNKQGGTGTYSSATQPVQHSHDGSQSAPQSYTSVTAAFENEASKSNDDAASSNFEMSGEAPSAGVAEEKERERENDSAAIDREREKEESNVQRVDKHEESPAPPVESEAP